MIKPPHMITIPKYIWVTALYLIISFILLYKPLLTPGIFNGGDWSSPYTSIQINNYIRASFYSWFNIATLIGSYRSYLNDIPYSIFLFILSSLGLSGPQISKIILWGLYSSAGISMYAFLRYIKLAVLSSFIGGLLYITSPFFFNYTVMGWIFVLLALVLLPLFIIFVHKALNECSALYICCSALIFSLAILGSVTIVIYPLILLLLTINRIKKTKNLISPVIISTTIFLLTLLTNAHWIVNIFINPDPIVSGSENVLSSVSLGTWQKLNFVNLIRGWGSLYNYSFEISYISVLKPLTFILPLLALLATINRNIKSKVEKKVFVLLFFLPITLYILGPNYISKFPFSNVIRDIARLSVLVSFSLVTLATIYLNNLFKTKRDLLAVFLILLLILAANPFLSGALWGNNKAEDIRLRNLSYDNSFILTENYLNNTKSTSKAIYLPINTGSNDYSNPNFRWAYNQMTNIFQTYSPKSGILSLSDKENQGSNPYNRDLLNNLLFDFNKSIPLIINSLNLEYFVFYHNSMNPEDWIIYKNVKGSKYFKEVTQEAIDIRQGKVSIFRALKSSQEISVSQNFNIISRSNTDPLEINKMFLQKDIFSSPTIGNKSLIHLPQRVYENIIKSEWNKGWPWPKVNHNPNNFLFSLILLYEEFEERLPMNDYHRVDVLLWTATKRVAELEKFKESDKTILTTNFNQKYLKLKMVLDQMKEKNRGSADYNGLLVKVYQYLNKAAITGFSTRELDDFTEWLKVNFSSEIIEPLIIQEPGRLFLIDSDGKPQESNPEKIVYVPTTKVISSVLEKDLEIYSYHNIGESYVENNTDLLVNIVENKTLPFVYQKTFLIPNPTKSLYLKFDYQFNGKAKILTNQKVTILKDVFQSEGMLGNLDEKYTYPLTKDLKPVEDWTSFEQILNLDQNSQELNVYFVFEKKPPLNTLRNIKIEEKKEPRIFVENASYSIDNKAAAPTVSFLKVNPTRYKIKLDNANSNFGLILKQRYHPGWNVYLNESGEDGVFVTNHLKKIGADNHYVANGYANGWIINLSELNNKKNTELIINFDPQTTTNWGFIISLITLMILSLLVITKLTTSAMVKMSNLHNNTQ